MKQHDYILIDRSGSMANKWGETLSGVNAYVKALASKDETKNIAVTVVVFDSINPFEVVRKHAIPSKWEEITEREVFPRGYTPLFDAIGKLVSTAISDAPVKAAIVILTDGAENSSKEYNKISVKTLLDTCRSKEWQVVFLGADFDNMEQAKDLGNAYAQTMSYNSVNTESVFRSMGSTRGIYASGAGNMNFNEQARKEAADPKAKAP